MKCNWCGSSGDCADDCECQKCVDPVGYDNWKFNPDKTFSEPYKKWLLKEREKYNSVDKNLGSRQLLKHNYVELQILKRNIFEPLEECMWCEKQSTQIISLIFSEQMRERYCITCLSQLLESEFRKKGDVMKKCEACGNDTNTALVVPGGGSNGFGDVNLCDVCIATMDRQIIQICTNQTEALSTPLDKFFWN